MLKFESKTLATILAASIFLCTAPTQAEPELTAEQRDEADFTTYAPVVDEPFSDDVQAPKPEEITQPSPQENKPAIEQLFNPPPKVEQPPQDDAGEGLEFLVYNENGVMAFAVIAAHEQYKLRPVLARNQISGLATISQISSGYNDIAMVNASYFMRNGGLIGLTKINGVIVSNDYFNRSAIGINDDGSTVFGRVKYDGKIIYRGAEIPVNVNSERSENRAVVYNEYFGASTGTNSYGIEIEERGGVITNIFRDKGNNFILKDSRIISAHGTAAEIFKDAQIGDEIIFSEQIISDDADFNSVANILGAGPRLVANGQIFVTADAEQFPADIKFGRAPRSAVGVTQWGDYILAVVDGRQAQSRGCTLQEWAEILLNKFGAVNAINLDGGGSSELVVKDKLVNSPSDGSERYVGSALAILPK